MGNLPEMFLRRLEGRLGGIAYELTRLRFASFYSPATWVPAINAYRCRDGFVICVDLAGLDRSGIDVRVESRRLIIRGQRQLPEPEETAGPPLHVLAMEIDHGPFAREVVLPAEVDPEEVRAEQRNGLLWISLPLRTTD